MSELTTPTVPQETRQDFLNRSLAPVMALDWEKIAYATILILAVITRVWALGERVMSHDESLHTWFSLNFARGEGYQHTPLMHGPFLFHITALSYWLFGASDFTARLPVALLGVVLVIMPYFLRPWLGRIGALVTSFLLLISPYVTYYSRYIRHDVLAIVAALIVLITIWYYIRNTAKEKYLWIFAGGLGWLFTTKEVSYIYVAIFGSFLVLRLVGYLWQQSAFRRTLSELRQPALVLGLALLLLGGGFVGLRLDDGGAAESAVTVTPEGDAAFAADPAAADIVGETGARNPGSFLHWLQVAGALLIGVSALLFARALRPLVDRTAEFDLIVLFSTLLLPFLAPVLVVLAGYPARDYTLNRCELAGEVGRLEYALAHLFNSTCRAALFESPLLYMALFTGLLLAVAIAVGLWWDNRRWPIAAAIFHGIIFFFYTSVFTNPQGWGSGVYDSLAYWLEQQEVQRGSQPWFYYLFVTPLYEFLPIFLSLLAIRLWARRRQLSRTLFYWASLVLVAWLAFSFSGWLLELPGVLDGVNADRRIAPLVAAIVLFVGALYWVVAGRQGAGAAGNGGSQLRLQDLLGFVPLLIWWTVLTWIIYSAAGEKMPWLSIHFVIPMAFLGGWYLNERLREVDTEALRAPRTWALVGLVALFVVALVVALKPLLLGEIRFGNQELLNLAALGQFLGALLIAGALVYGLRELGGRVSPSARSLAGVLGVTLILVLLTVRFTYMAVWPNADSTREFLVYAHGAPAVKEVVVPQIEQLSQRLHGDDSLKVAWSNDVTWPIQWYLKDYPNRFFAGQTPTASIREYPIVIVGNLDWANYDTFLQEDEYERRDYTFLWWPMEDYRQIGWSALLGLEEGIGETGGGILQSSGRGLFNPQVRQSLWDIFFHRDYQQYANTFGGTFSAGEWPLRHELRVYIRRDALASLWDFGVSAATIEPPVDPYAEGELLLTPELVIGDEGLHEGELVAPRNLALGPGGNIYVLDSGQHRVVVFGPNGQLLTTWGTPGMEPGQFNEPWGIAVDEEYVYVADTWNHRVQKFTLDGELVTVFGESGTVGEMGQQSGGFFFGPRSIALLPENQLVVTDTGNHRLQIYDRDGNFVNTVGSLGTAPGQLNEPVGLAFGEGSLFLADTWNARIQRFTPDLIPIGEWSVDGWEGQSTENKPYLAVDAEGRVYATDPENFRVLIFAADGTYLARFGQPGTALDQFGLPNGIAIDAENNIYIADAHNNRVLRFPAAHLGPPAPVEIESGEQSGVDEEVELDGEEEPLAPEEAEAEEPPAEELEE